MLLNQFVQFAEFGAAKAARLGKLDRLQPKFRIALCLLDMDMTGFGALTAEEEKAASTDTEHFWHRCKVIR